MSENQKSDKNAALLNEIMSYYIPEQLRNAIIARGSIPDVSQDQYIGVGFLDIVQYEYLSNFITPRENQILLNGLYTAFYNILVARNGYLNKMEGDSIMFHFGGELDSSKVGLSTDDQLTSIGRDLFFSCIEMQKASAVFNKASSQFLDYAVGEDQKPVLAAALAIIESLRSQTELLTSFDGLFQLRVRIGAAIGEVSGGNFGPPGAKQWDVIGVPVIVAKRMESTAPYGGLRISQDLYDILDKSNLVNEYCDQLREEGLRLGSKYQSMENHEVFRYHKVVIKEKKNAVFDTYGVQVNAALPKDIRHQVTSLLELSHLGAEKIVDLIMHYRGNRYVLDEIEECFEQLNIKIRKAELLKVIFPKRYKELNTQDSEVFEKTVDEQNSLYDLCEKLNQYQSIMNQELLDTPSEAQAFNTYDEAMNMEYEYVKQKNQKQSFYMIQRAHFYNTVMPLVCALIKNSILEYQQRPEESDLLEELESADILMEVE